MLAIKELPEYQPTGELVFPCESKLWKEGKFFWTSGVTERTVPLLTSEQYPGLNKLATLWVERMKIENEDM